MFRYLLLQMITKNYGQYQIITISVHQGQAKSQVPNWDHNSQMQEEDAFLPLGGSTAIEAETETESDIAIAQKMSLIKFHAYSLNLGFLSSFYGNGCFMSAWHCGGLAET